MIPNTMAAHALPLAAAIQEAMQPESHLNRGKHTKYHLRCLKTLLPNGYQGTDANRMMLAYFNLASLDLLQSLDTCMKDDERAGYIEWIYSCQFPEGGFRAFPGTDFGVERRDRNNEHWDPPNAAGTLFALVNLLMLGDDLQRVNRKNTLAWLKTLQHEDGSFGETIGPNGKPNGGQDMRYAYMCIGVRHILRGVRDQGIPDIDLDKVVRFVIDSQVRYFKNGCV
jgi:geranylgeranyl transferase type-1 subunit beta